MTSLTLLGLALVTFVHWRADGLSKRELLGFANRPLLKRQPRDRRSARDPAKVIGALL